MIPTITYPLGYYEKPENTRTCDCDPCEICGGKMIPHTATITVKGRSCISGTYFYEEEIECFGNEDDHECKGHEEEGR